VRLRCWSRPARRAGGSVLRRIARGCGGIASRCGSRAGRRQRLSPAPSRLRVGKGAALCGWRTTAVTSALTTGAPTFRSVTTWPGRGTGRGASSPTIAGCAIWRPTAAPTPGCMSIRPGSSASSGRRRLGITRPLRMTSGGWITSCRRRKSWASTWMLWCCGTRRWPTTAVCRCSLRPSPGGRIPAPTGAATHTM